MGEGVGLLAAPRLGRPISSEEPGCAQYKERSRVGSGWGLLWGLTWPIRAAGGLEEASGPGGNGPLVQLPSLGRDDLSCFTHTHIDSLSHTPQSVSHTQSSLTAFSHMYSPTHMCTCAHTHIYTHKSSPYSYSLTFSLRRQRTGAWGLGEVILTKSHSSPQPGADLGVR